MLRIESVHAGYAGSEVLYGISLDVPADSAVTILGRNGAGKSTTLRAVMGLCQVTRGTIGFAGLPLDGFDTSIRAQRGIALVPDYRGVFASLSVRENLDIAVRKHSRWRVQDVFDLFPRLKERQSNAGSALSGGEQQMLAIGRALLTDPKLLILDEPTEGLAPIIVERIVEVMLDVRKRGVAVLLVEQNLDVCLAIGDRHYIMEDGQIVFSATTEEFKHRTDLHEKYLGV
jgi:branched-chain amino acid transport system ATP-binding protein